MSSAAVQGMATRSVKQLKIESLSTCSSYPKRYFLFIITGELSFTFIELSLMNTEKESSLFYCFNGSGLNSCLLIDSEKAARVHTCRVSAVNHLCFPLFGTKL